MLPQQETGAERGRDRRHADSSTLRRTRVLARSPDTVAAKIARTVHTLSLSRFDLKFSDGTMPHDRLLRAIELYDTKVSPRVRELPADNAAAQPAGQRAQIDDAGVSVQREIQTLADRLLKIAIATPPPPSPPL